MFLAKYLGTNDLPFRPKAIFLIAGAYALPDFPDKDCKDFLVEPALARELVGKTDKLFIMHSKDDFVVPYEHGLALKQVVPEAEFLSFTDKNHFLVAELPELIDTLRKISRE